MVARRPFPGEFSAVLIRPGLAARDVPRELIVSVRKLWPGLSAADGRGTRVRWIGCPWNMYPPSAIRVITPHPGEAARLLRVNDGAGAGKSSAGRAGDFQKVRQLLGGAQGHQTLIRAERGEFLSIVRVIHISRKGGGGDVLASFIAGLLAQTGLRRGRQAGRCVMRSATTRRDAWMCLQATQRNWTVEELATTIGESAVIFARADFAR